MAFADFFVAVLVAGRRVFAVVDMDGLEPIQTDNPVKLGNHAVQIVDDIVAAVGNVAGIKTYPQLVVDGYTVDDGPKLLKAAADLAALAGHGFQQHRGGLLLGKDFVKHFGDVGNALFDPLTYVASRMKIIIVPRGVFHPPQVVCHGFLGELPCFLLVGAGVQCVGCVCQYAGKMMLRRKGQEFLDILFIDGLGFASSGVSGEKLKGISPQLHRGFPHMKVPLGCRQVTADMQHNHGSPFVLISSF